jgi:uncharacterized protein YcfJ
MSLSMVKIGASSLIALSVFSVSAPAFANRDDNRGYYNQSRDYYYQDSRYEDDNDRREADYQRERAYSERRCNKGTGGTIIGAIAGGLLGHEVVGRRGDKTVGVIIGAGVGALAGRAIDRAGNRGRC